MTTVARFEDLEVWQKARILTRSIYTATNAGGFARDFRLKDQIRAASVSVMSNIAEGFERDGNKEFYQFLAIAKGSIGEVRAQLFVALDVGYLAQSEFETLASMAVEISRMLRGFMKYLKQCNISGDKYRN